MTSGNDKLTRDLEFLGLLASQMDAYLMSDAIFWKTTHPNLPDLSLGGYLMRQHRLLSLRDLLDSAQRSRLDTAVTQFNQALVEKSMLFEQKANRELEARLRQWEAYLNDLREEGADAAAYYKSSVEARVMIAALLDKLQLASFDIGPHIPDKITSLDDRLRQRWRSGPFVWPSEWQPAYPQVIYWWLYGQPA